MNLAIHESFLFPSRLSFAGSISGLQHRTDHGDLVNLSSGITGKEQDVNATT
jgi:hypothetical protein